MPLSIVTLVKLSSSHSPFSTSSLDIKIQNVIYDYVELIFLIHFLILFILQSQLSSADQMRGANISNIAGMEQTRLLANTLAQNSDPKFQVCLLLSNLVSWSGISCLLEL